MECNNVSLKQFSSLAVGGVGQMVVLSSYKDIMELYLFAKREDKRIIPLGEGTNTFFGDLDERSIVAKICTKGISLEDKGDEVLLTAEAGERFDDVVSFAVNHGLWGIENLSHIPGCVGAAPIQNIGAYGVELQDVLVSVAALDSVSMNLVSISNEACAFGYRDSLFKQDPGRYCVVSVTIRLSKLKKLLRTYKPLDLLPDDCSLTSVREEVIRVRTEKIPDYKEYPNAGSFFKNPLISNALAEEVKKKYPDVPCIIHGAYTKIPAAWLLEHVASAKGLRKDNVGTWPTQPLVIVNYGNADANEVMAFSELLIKKVYEATGILLEREVNYIH